MTQRVVPVADPGAIIQRHRQAVDTAIARVLDSGSFILGPEVEQFEREFADWAGATHAVSVASGTDAVELALRATGVAPGEVVFVPTNTAVATVAAIERAGAVPALCDVDEETYNLSPASLERAICNVPAALGRPRAVVAVHLYGLPADLASIAQICRNNGLLLIEDCAQAHGASIDGQPVGTTGDAGAFSFYPTKNLGALGDGGMVTTRQDEVATRARRLRQYGWEERYISIEPGINSRLDELQAAVLRTLLPHLRAGNHRREALAGRYLSDLAGSALVLPTVPDGARPVWHQFVVRSVERDRLRAHLNEAGIATAILYPSPVHLQPAYRDRTWTDGELPTATQLSGEILSLPIGDHLTEADADRVVAAVLASAP